MVVTVLRTYEYVIGATITIATEVVFRTTQICSDIRNIEKKNQVIFRFMKAVQHFSICVLLYHHFDITLELIH